MHTFVAETWKRGKEALESITQMLKRIQTLATAQMYFYQDVDTTRSMWTHNAHYLLQTYSAII